MNNEQNTATDVETNAIYKITENPETPADVKKYLLDYLFEKNGISVEISEAEAGENQPASGKPETTKKEMEDVKIEIYTNWKAEKGDTENLARMRIEKSCLMASALFHLIEVSCMPYDELMLGEADPKFAQNHIESIRTAAELGKQLAYQI